MEILLLYVKRFLSLILTSFMGSFNLQIMTKLVVQGQCVLPWPSCSPHANWGQGDNPHGRLFSDPCALIITTNCQPTQQASLRSLLSALQSAGCKANSEICTLIYLFFSTNNIYYLHKNKKIFFKVTLVSKMTEMYYIRIKWHFSSNTCFKMTQLWLFK